MAFSINETNGQRGIFGRRRFGGGQALAEMNIVPLVDVVLVLLIIFMLTAHVMEFGLEINVPEVKQVRDTAEELPVVNVTHDARLFLNERPVNINKLAGEIQRRFKGAKTVYLVADRATVWDPIAQVMSALNEAKLGIKVVVKPEESNTRR
jgi:biopolymer transport protein ExbD